VEALHFKERRKEKKKKLDYTRLLSRALRAIRCANVRSGILPPQSGFRRNDEQEKGEKEKPGADPFPNLPLNGRAKAPQAKELSAASGS
jgi:hypothetical protein